MNTVAWRFFESVDRYAFTVAMRWKEGGVWRGMTYRELSDEVRAVAKGLLAIGIKPGERVCIFSPNRPEWTVCDLATISVGAISVPIYATSAPETVNYIVQHCEAVCGLGFSGTPPRRVFSLDSLEDLKEEGRSISEEELDLRIKNIRSEDVATIIYTSGTTGVPKGVILTHSNLVSNCDASAQCFPVTTGDRTLSFLPLSHALERTAGSFLMLFHGVTISFAEDLNSVPKNLMETKPTILISVPRVLEKFYARVHENIQAKPRLLRNLFAFAMKRAHKGKRDWIFDLLFFKKIRARLGGSLRLVVSGGAALSVEIGEFFHAIGIPLIEGYGLTETSPVVSVNRVDRNKLGTVGPPISGVEVKIAPDSEILVRGPNVMKGYYKEESATKEAIDQAGWFHTGDVGELDSDGFLKITDRKKEILVTSGGKKAAPQPMENELKLDPLINQVCVVGDGRNYLSALIVPNHETLKARLGSDLALQDSRVTELFQNLIDRFNSKRASYETIKKFALLPMEWSVEAGEITPTLKVRRKEIYKKYARVIDQLYV